MSFVRSCGSLAICLWLIATAAFAYDPNKFPGSGNEADWQKACDICNRGNELAKQGNYADAMKQYELSLSTYPMAPTYCNMGNTLKRANRLKEAIASYQKSIDLAPDYARPHAGLADVYLKEGNFSAAESESKIAIKINPDNAIAKINLAESYIGMKRFDEARKWLDSASLCHDAQNPGYKNALQHDYELITKQKVAGD